MANHKILSPDTSSRFKANDGTDLAYHDYGNKNGKPLVLIHGFTGSSEVFKRITPTLGTEWRVIVPDLRGHGKNPKQISGYHVSRLAMDLKNLVDHLGISGQIDCIGASLGCAVIWSYCELFGTGDFSRLIFVDQAPLQNYTADWGQEYGNRSCNSADALADVQATLEQNPDEVYKATIASCLGYRSHPLPTDEVSEEEAADDEKFFLAIAQQGDGHWFGKLMADHTALDWRDSIRHSFAFDDRHKPPVMVIASERSGCFPSAGPLKVVDLVNESAGECLATGKNITWGGHWCYWEDPKKFNDLVIPFLRSRKV